VKHFLTGYDLANTVRMAHTQRHVTFMLVEGETDLYTLTPFVVATQCEILVCHNRGNALEALYELDKTHEKGFLGIVDADYSRLLGREPTSPNCVLTEFHDLGVVVFQSAAFNKVLRERGSGEKIRIFEAGHRMLVQDALFDAACPLGYLRLINERDGLGLCFQDLNYSRLFQRDDLAVDLSKLVVTVVQRSKATVSVEAVLRMLRMAMTADHDPRLVCSGHDIVALFAIGLRQLFGTQPAILVPDIERELRLAFDKDCFLGTLIYSSIVHWEDRNPGWPVLRVL